MAGLLGSSGRPWLAVLAAGAALVWAPVEWPNVLRAGLPGVRSALQIPSTISLEPLPGQRDFRLAHHRAEVRVGAAGWSLATAGKKPDVRLRLAGADLNAPVGEAVSTGERVSYFLGSDPGKWRTGVALMRRVRYREVLPGTDLAYYGSGEQLEFDFLLRPGADPAAIRMRLDGADDVEVTPSGDLLIHTAGGTIRQRKPVAYQQDCCERIPVSCEYRLEGRELCFALGKYDAARELVIDPVLETASYFGGSLGDLVRSMATDSQGNIFVLGTTGSPDFPTETPVQPVGGGMEDLFVAKLSPDGRTRLWSTYLGGSQIETAGDIAVDHADRPIVVGRAGTGFPTTNGVFSQTHFGGGDAFVTKLAANGQSLIASTYWGGTESDTATGVDADSLGNIYVSGYTLSTNIPVMHALQPNAPSVLGDDGFVFKMPPDASELTWSTYLGGASSENTNGVTTGLPIRIAVNSQFQPFVFGFTNSANFPLVNAHSVVGSAFLCKFAADGQSLDFSTMVQAFEPGGIALMPDDTPVICGIAGENSGFVAVNPVQVGFRSSVDLFVSHYSTDGQQLLFATPYGGNSFDHAFAIDADAEGRVYVIGKTVSTDFPLVNPVDDTVVGSDSGVFGARESVALCLDLSGTPVLRYATALGGSNTDSGLAVTAVNGGAAYGGLTRSLDFPVVNAFQQQFGGPINQTANDGWIAVITDGGGGGSGAPTGLTGSSCLGQSRLAWNDTNDELGYEIQRSDNGGPFTKVGETPANLNGFTDLDLTPGIAYAYRVIAVYASGPSAPSQAIDVTPGSSANSGTLKFKAKTVKLAAKVGKSRQTRLTFQNVHKVEPLIVCVGGLGGPLSVVGGPTTFTLQPKQKATVVLEFRPLAKGKVDAVLGISTTDAAKKTIRLAVSGTAK